MRDGFTPSAVHSHCLAKITHKTPLHISTKTVFTVFVGVIGALALGVGMCFCMFWSKLVLGIMIGLPGIFVLLCLIPLTKGIRAV